MFQKSESKINKNALGKKIEKKKEHSPPTMFFFCSLKEKDMSSFYLCLYNFDGGTPYSFFTTLEK